MSLIGLGGWLFKNRGWLPIPIFLVQLIVGGGVEWGGNTRVWFGLALVVAGELFRVWAVGYIGNRSRTLGSDVTGLETRGPYRLSRNPLYIANIVLWAGVGLVTGWLWLVIWLVLLVPYYNLIVRFEESNLITMGESYRDYSELVGRWFPRGNDLSVLKTSWSSPWSLTAALRSERTTLCAIIAIIGALFFI